MHTHTTVFIARSLDGYIAGPDGELDWLEMVPNPRGIDTGFGPLMARTDAIVMGRSTYETVLGFGGDWPYPKPVFVLSDSLKTVPDNILDKVQLLNGEPEAILETLHDKGYHQLYIDGGGTIQRFLVADLIDEMIITTLPILLGGGFPLFGHLEKPLAWEHVSTDVFLGQLVQSHYKRK